MPAEYETTNQTKFVERQSIPSNRDEGWEWKKKYSWNWIGIDGC